MDSSAPSRATGGPDDMAASIDAVVEHVAESPEQGAKRRSILAARTLWFSEQLPEELYPEGQITITKLAELRRRVGSLEGGADVVQKRLDQIVMEHATTRGPGGGQDTRAIVRLREQARGFAEQQEDVKEAIGAALEASDGPAPRPLAKLRAAARAELVDFERRAVDLGTRLEGTREGVRQLAAPLGHGTESNDLGIGRPRGDGSGSGGGGGGGGGEDQFTKDASDGLSEMTIHGGGKITSPDGFTIVSGGSILEITPSGVSITAPLVMIKGGEITISGGPVGITGTPIKLNCSD